MHLVEIRTASQMAEVAKFIEANSPTELLYNAAECDFNIVLAAGSLTVHRGPILLSK